jgi:putative membrane protein
MKRIIQGVMLAGTLVVGSTSFAQPATKAAAPKAGTAEYKGFVVPTDPKGLLERLHYVNQTEIKQGQLALKNATNPDVKSFAQQMITEHTAADEKIMALAKTQNLKLADMPKPLNDTEKKAMAADKASMEKLQSLKGEAFDGCYMTEQLGAHDATLGKLAAARQGAGANPELTSLMDELNQSVAKHRQHAYALLGKLGPQPAMGGAGTGTDTMGTGTDTGAGTTGSGTRK